MTYLVVACGKDHNPLWSRPTGGGALENNDRQGTRALNEVGPRPPGPRFARPQPRARTLPNPRLVPRLGSCQPLPAGYNQGHGAESVRSAAAQWRHAKVSPDRWRKWFVFYGGRSCNAVRTDLSECDADSQLLSGRADYRAGPSSPCGCMFGGRRLAWADRIATFGLNRDGTNFVRSGRFHPSRAPRFLSRFGPHALPPPHSVVDRAGLRAARCWRECGSRCPGFAGSHPPWGAA